MVHDQLVLDGGRPAQAVLSAAAVVGPLDSGDDPCPQLFPGGPLLAVEHVLLQEGEEGLHRRVVPSCTNLSYRADQPVAAERVLE